MTGERSYFLLRILLPHIFESFSACQTSADMTDEHQRKTAVQTVAAVFLPIATITVMLRIYVRGWIVKAFGWDDGAMVIALVCSILNSFPVFPNLFWWSL